MNEINDYRQVIKCGLLSDAQHDVVFLQPASSQTLGRHRDKLVPTLRKLKP